MSTTAILSTKPRLLYLSINDGSDTRINKEIATLSRVFDIDFVGIAAEGSHAFIATQVCAMEVIRGRRRSPFTLIKLAWRVLQLRWAKRYHSIHVINENLYLILLPLLLGRPVVLDVFDSMFLKSQLPGWLARFGQRCAYSLPVKIIVTDIERAGLMPADVQDKLIIVPNYPFRYMGPRHPRNPAQLRVLYVGSLSENRGTSFARQLLEAADDARIVMAGWLYDEPVKEFARHPRVEWLGTLPQAQIIERATACDFILCHYEPISVNNIYASPNKIYDAIQAGIAVIINPEVKVSGFVRDHGLGVVLEAYQPADFKAVAQALRDFKNGYHPDPALRDHYIWERVEASLLHAHDAPGQQGGNPAGKE